MKIHSGKIALFSLILQFVIVVPSLADVIQMERQEVIQRSGLIFVGEVLKQDVHWNDKGNLIVTDYTIRVDEVLFGKHDQQTIVLTFAGGQLAKEGQSVSDVPKFLNGDRVLLMIEESPHPLLSPVTGMYQGKYTAVNMQGVDKPVAFDGRDVAVKNEDGEVVLFEDFVQMVKNEIPEAKSKPLPDRTVPPELQKSVLNDLPALQYDPLSSGTPADIYVPQATDEVPDVPQIGGLKKVFSGSQEMEVGTGGEGPLYWSYSHRAKNVPIVFNPWPDSFPAWALHHDQFAMSYWNNYADIYRVMAPTGNWAWGNDRYDMAGFPDNQTMIDQFGVGWGSSELAVTWLRWDGTGFSIEADIACNPAFSWTTDDYTTYNNPNLYNLDRTLTHEVGHSWGLDHQFNFLSVMNYAPHKYRAYNVIYMDDSSGVRAAFPAQTIGRSDLDVALFYSAGYQDYDDSNLSTQSVMPGGSITVSNFVIENVGTVTMTPEIGWYLVPVINNWSGAQYVGTTTHASLAPSNWFLTSRTLTIPSSMPPGSYYLGAYVSNSTDSLGANNSSWLDRVITVTSSAPPNDNWANTIIVDPPFVTGGTNVGATTETGEQDLGPAEATVWWSFYAETSGDVTINTFGSNFDTMLHIYTGWPANLSDLTLVAANDDAGGGLQSQVMFSAVAGQRYEIRVGGYLGAQGNIVLQGDLIPTGGFVPPSDYEVFRGLELEGSLEHFADSDDIRARYNPSFTLTNSEAPVWLIFDGVSPSAFEFTLESNAGTPGLTKTVDFWAYDVNQYEVVAVQAESFNTDQVLTIPVNSFNIGAGGEVRSRIGWRKTGITLNYPWEVRIDQVGWTQ